MSTGKYGICGWLVRRVAGGLWGVLVEIAVGVLLSGTRVAGPSYDLLLLVVPRCCSVRVRRRARRALTFCVVAVTVRGERMRL
ncbi:hypothetical protein I2W78_15160 [Streptomyces spinoverrucosus]|uniref:hypothetical protein n=1 Tax=Streptomyces spinoverrucosus TaxID=284043 RepID=UPI0018C4003A|nr:hypothetical protein [Streptomyces spinoverrucosus]MBG0853152.1 hypothetical protein [Streptomyces spinoverrucosus]